MDVDFKLDFYTLWLIPIMENEYGIHTFLKITFSCSDLISKLHAQDTSLVP